MNDDTKANGRSAIIRARFFLKLAREAPAADRDAYEAYLDASILFARAALHRLHTRFRSNVEFKVLWNSLLNDEAVNFFRLHRDRVLKEAPVSVGQRISMDTDVRNADELYFFEPERTAAQTLTMHLDRIEAIVQRCDDFDRLGFDVGDDISFDERSTEGLEDRRRAVESYQHLRQRKFADGKKCFYCDGSGIGRTGETCSHCQGLGYLA